MKTHFDDPFDPRIEALARSVGQEHSLHLGNAIGNVLAIAWEALEALGALLARVIPRPRGAARKVI